MYESLLFLYDSYKHYKYWITNSQNKVKTGSINRKSHKKRFNNRITKVIKYQIKRANKTSGIANNRIKVNIKYKWTKNNRTKSRIQLHIKKYINHIKISSLIKNRQITPLKTNIILSNTTIK
jgi:hypothetical protein